MKNKNKKKSTKSTDDGIIDIQCLIVSDDEEPGIRLVCVSQGCLQLCNYNEYYSLVPSVWGLKLDVECLILKHTVYGPKFTFGQSMGPALPSC